MMSKMRTKSKNRALSPVINIETFRHPSRPSRFKKPALSFGDFDKTQVLQFLYSSRRTTAEGKTIQALERCQLLIHNEIEMFFRKKRDHVLEYIRDRYQVPLISVSELESLTSKCQDILQQELEKCFGVCSKFNNLEYKFSQLEKLFQIIEEDYRTTQQSLFVTQQVERWSKLAWDQVSEYLNFSSDFLNYLGINSKIQMLQQRNGIREQFNGVILSVKLNMLHEVNQKVAQIFFDIYDKGIDRKLAKKIREIEEKLYTGTQNTLDVLEA